MTFSILEADVFYPILFNEMSEYMTADEKIIGVLGGMGPLATASFYTKLIEETHVSKDQDHYRVIIDSNPKIPDRTKAILYGGDSPVEEMIRTAQNLEKSGASVLVMPCITAHYFHEEIQKSVTIPFYHVLKGLSDFLDTVYPSVKRIGVLSTTATRRSNLFQSVIRNKEVVFPDDIDQETKVMEAIFGENGIKQGNKGDHPKRLLKEAADTLIQGKQCELIIGGCTEVELVLHSGDIPVPFIDPMKIAARNLTGS
ncbi:aspartate/glutamate racemase family protein [Alkalibacterium olivapovliticus]|uniref:Aspartate racemase n=1 Tax=Alkalibacterium olivapovliticus TaxID=99907 RepID=A0A2T0W6Q1_9LACT|nr:amino acid racemase [Alkalibacterium olivapovliticus]PRY82333.1 aspartate racemase [Alkalibacterium olivapovliticus]